MSEKTKVILITTIATIVNIFIPRTTDYPVVGFEISEFGFIGSILTLYTPDKSANLFTAIRNATDFHVSLGNLVLSVVIYGLIINYIIKKFTKTEKIGKSQENSKI